MSIACCLCAKITSRIGRSVEKPSSTPSIHDGSRERKDRKQKLPQSTQRIRKVTSLEEGTQECCAVAVEISQTSTKNKTACWVNKVLVFWVYSNSKPFTPESLAICFATLAEYSFITDSDSLTNTSARGLVK